MAENFIPGPDGEALGFFITFSSALSADPGTYDVSVADAAMLAGLVSDFQTKWTVVQNPATKTSVTVLQKDESRAALEEVVRLFASQIKVNAGIDAADKEAIGVKPPTTVRTPIPAPETNPMLSFLGSTPDGAHTLRYSDSANPDSRARPFGAQSLQLFRTIAVEQADDPGSALFYGVFTRNPLTVDFRASDNGKWVTYWARWCNNKGEVGPWSNPLPLPIATTATEAA